MRVLVVSDTHLGPASLDRMPAEVWTMADDADVVLHAGDVTEQVVLDELRSRARLHVVQGNNDRSLAGTLPGVMLRTFGGVDVAMIHDSGALKGRPARLARMFPAARVVVFGHSHDPVLEETEHGQLLVNPGSPTQRRRQPVHTVAWLELADGAVARAEIVPVGPLA